MTPRQTELYRQCCERGIGPTVRDRIVRLNPTGSESRRVRGWHPSATAKHLMMMHDVIGKGAFIKRHGRAAWDALPNGMLWKCGRRKYLGRVAYLDNVWKIWAGEIPPCEMMAWFPTKKYANDTNLVIDYISREEFARRRAS